MAMTAKGRIKNIEAQRHDLSGVENSVKIPLKLSKIKVSYDRNDKRANRLWKYGKTVNLPLEKTKG